MGKVNYEVKEGVLVLGADLNKDGQNSVELGLSINEAIQEVLAKGQKIEGQKSVSVSLDGLSLVVVVDSDKDGEKLLNLRVDLSEVVDETGLLK